MKTIRSSNWIRVVFWCLALALAVILLTISLLTKGISLITGDAIEPEKLDIRPIPVPMPPPALVISKSLASATPSPELSAIVPVAIAVPTPPESVRMPASVAQPSKAELSSVSTIQIVNPQGILVMASTLLVLLIWLRFRRTLDSGSLQKECT